MLAGEGDMPFGPRRNRAGKRRIRSSVRLWSIAPFVGYAAYIALIFGMIGWECEPEDSENIRRLRKPDALAGVSPFNG